MKGFIEVHPVREWCDNLTIRPAVTIKVNNIREFRKDWLMYRSVNGGEKSAERKQLYSCRMIIWSQKDSFNTLESYDEIKKLIEEAT